MSVLIEGVEKGSVAEDYGFEAGDVLFSINSHEINDVLDYRFYQQNEILSVTVIEKNGNKTEVTVEKEEFEELGLTFNSYLMDKKQSCRNKCIFCFIDQLPKGLRDSLYFKDDDSRLSFLFGNYITLTNISEREIERIEKMHISPINVSVHTTNPELRVQMMKNKNAGRALEILKRLDKSGIKLNSQIVLCRGYNDKAELERTLDDLSKLTNMECIAVVPVGLTKYRDNLTRLEPFDKVSAAEVIKTVDKYGDVCLEKYGQRRIYVSDEFYILAGREIPPYDYYGDFLQLENGVGMWALLKNQADDALKELKYNGKPRTVSMVTGMAAKPLIEEIARKCEEKYKGIKCRVYPVENNLFGKLITVAGLVTATDILAELKDKPLGDVLLVPSTMLRSERDMFLDSVTVEDLAKKLNINVKITDTDGFSLVSDILGNGEN